MGPASTPSAHLECLSPAWLLSFILMFQDLTQAYESSEEPALLTHSAVWAGVSPPPASVMPPSDWAVKGYLAVSRVNTLESTVCFVKKIKTHASLCLAWCLIHWKFSKKMSEIYTDEKLLFYLPQTRRTEAG